VRETVERGHEIRPVVVQIDFAVMHLVALRREFTNVGADHAASGEAALDHATAKAFAQRMHPGDFVLQIFGGDLASESCPQSLSLPLCSSRCRAAASS
jgi:hypothetical protein